MKLENNVLVSDSAEELARAAALRFVTAAQDAMRTDGRFAVSLAGGQTPRRVYQILGTEFTGLIDWSNVHLFFGDERCVPPDDPDSNYLMVYSTLISRLAIPPDNVHRMIGEGDPAANASAYEHELKNFFGNVKWPRFDLVFLGLGTDGHTASLFPGSGVVSETSSWVGTAKPAGASTDRITLTLPVLNSAAQIVFLVSGLEKAATLSRVLRPASGTLPPLPAQLVKPTNGTLVWLVDRNAASRL